MHYGNFDNLFQGNERLNKIKGSVRRFVIKKEDFKQGKSKNIGQIFLGQSGFAKSKQKTIVFFCHGVTGSLAEIGIRVYTYSRVRWVWRSLSGRMGCPSSSGGGVKYCF